VRTIERLGSIEFIRMDEEGEVECFACQTPTVYRIYDYSSESMEVCCGRCFRRIKAATEMAVEQYAKIRSRRTLRIFVVGFLVGMAIIAFFRWLLE
jgi:hypothetical protein